VTATNRVTPFATVEALPLRGRFMGNRGVLHRGRDVVRPWQVRRWITCRLEFRGRSVPQWVDGRYTVLFFHDEAVALAAGHRPCAECRWGDHVRFRTAWSAAHGGPPPRVEAMDERLHGERVEDRRQRRHVARWDSLPAGAFVAIDGRAALVMADRLVPWSPVGYGTPVARPRRGSVEVLTPPATLGVLAAGYRPDLAVERP